MNPPAATTVAQEAVKEVEIDTSKLTALSPEVISRQATVSFLSSSSCLLLRTLVFFITSPLCQWIGYCPPGLVFAIPNALIRLRLAVGLVRLACLGEGSPKTRTIGFRLLQLDRTARYATTTGVSNFAEVKVDVCPKPHVGWEM